MISVRNNIKFSRSYLSNLLLITMCFKLQSCMVLSEQPDQVSSQEAVTQEINQPSGGSSSSFGVNIFVRSDIILSFVFIFLSYLHFGEVCVSAVLIVSG